jgi:hypothetical protein
MDDLDQLKRLAGINQYKGLVEYQGSNISVTGTEKAQIQREKNIRPGDLEWFKLWFSRPYWLGFPAEFRGRK